MKITAISDTHGYTPDIKPCDIFIHAGDLSGPKDSYKQLIEWRTKIAPWLNSIPAKHKIFIAGNHDWALYEPNYKDEVLNLLDENVTYLEDEETVVEGLKIWGSPWSLEFCSWAFNCTDKQMGRIMAQCPADTDILVTHGPPYGILDRVINGDRCVGSFALLSSLSIIRPKLHIFGHIHEGRGEEDINGTKFLNVTYLNHRYLPIFTPTEILLATLGKETYK